MSLQSAYLGEGEDEFFKYIQKTCKTIFDVGCFAGTYVNGAKAVNSFTQLESVDVHYFDPVPEYIDEVEGQVKYKDKCFLNKFGLSNVTEDLPYYTEVMSFVNRSKTLPNRATEPDRIFKLVRGDEYVTLNNVEKIDFLKIDVEGFEKNVVEGFGDFLKNVSVIQFEYGGCWDDMNVKFADVTSILNAAGFTGYSRLYNMGLIPVADDFVDDYKFSNIVCYNKEVFASWSDDKFKK